MNMDSLAALCLQGVGIKDSQAASVIRMGVGFQLGHLQPFHPFVIKITNQYFGIPGQGYPYGDTGNNGFTHTETDSGKPLQLGRDILDPAVAVRKQAFPLLQGIGFKPFSLQRKGRFRESASFGVRFLVSGKPAFL